jgi:hypothetical protein
MTNFIIQGTEPIIKIDSLGIGIKSYSNVDVLNLNDYEYLVVGDSQGNPNGGYSNLQMFTKHNLYVNHQGVAINTNREEMSKYRDADTSLYVSKNIYCDGVINAVGGIQFSNITIKGDINSNLVVNMIKTINDNTNSQPFKVGLSTKFTNKRDISYPVNNIYSPNYITLGGRVDTYYNQHPLNINSLPNNRFDNIHLAIRNNASSDTDISKLSKLSIGIIGSHYESPAVISTTTGMPLEFHVSKDASVIDASYNKNPFPTYSYDAQYPAMAIDAGGTVCIAKNKSDSVTYFKTELNDGMFVKKEYQLQKCQLDVNGISIFKDILIRDTTGGYKHIDDIYIRTGEGLGNINPSQIGKGIFSGSDYKFNNDLSAKKLTTENIVNSFELRSSNITTTNITVENNATFIGNTKFINPNGISIDKLKVDSDLYIGDRRITPIDIGDAEKGYTSSSTQNGSNYFFTYINSNLVNLDFNNNLSCPNRLSVGNPNGSFTGMLNINKNYKSSNIFEVVLNTEEGVNTKIGRVSYTELIDINDKSLIVNTNKIPNKKNNIYFYPSYNIENLQNTPSYDPMLSITDTGVGINNKIPRKDLHLDINGKIAATDYYVSKDNLINKMSGFIQNNIKDYFNIYNENIYKYCINYDSISSYSSKMQGLNVKHGINSDAYYQDDKLIETLKSTANLDGFYTNNKIAIGWKNDDNTLKVPLQIRNTSTDDYNYSIIRIYQGVDGKGPYNDAAFSGIDICENGRDLERWFIYKNHTLNDNDKRGPARIGPLQFGYTADKTIDPTTFAMSMYYNDRKSKYHIDFNNPVLHTDVIPESTVSIYGDLDVYGNINIIDNNSSNFNFRIKKLEGLSEYVNVKYYDINSDIYSSNIVYKSLTGPEDIEYSGKNIIFTPRESIIVESLDSLEPAKKGLNKKIPFVVKQNDDSLSVAKFITYSSSNINASSAIELCIYGNNDYTTAYDRDPTNIKNKVRFNVANDINNNTKLTFSYFKKELNKYKPFVEFNNINGSKTYMRLGQSENKNYIDSNISLHIVDENECGIQITNAEKPTRINMVNSSSSSLTNKYTILSSGTSLDNYKFNIGVANTKSTNSIDVNNELQNIFTISPYNEDNRLRKGAKFGFNESLEQSGNNPKQTVIINSEYDNEPMIITGRYTKDFIYTDIRINTSNIDIPIYTISSNLYNTNDAVESEYRTQITHNIPYENVGNVDIRSSPINIDNKDKIVTKTLHGYSNISYTSIHSNVDLLFNFSDNNRFKIDFNNYRFVKTEQSGENNYNITFDNPNTNIQLFNISSLLSYYNNTIIDRHETDIIDNINISHTPPNTNTFKMNLIGTILPSTEIQFTYAFTNSYKIPKYLNKAPYLNTSLQPLNNSLTSNIENIIYEGKTSNIIRFTNEIYTYLYNEQDSLINARRNYKICENVYSSDKIAEISNVSVFLKTKTSNIFWFDPQQEYTGKFDINRNNKLNIYSSNTIPNTRTNNDFSMNIISKGNYSSNIIDITTSNKFIDSRYNTKLVLSNIEIIDKFKIIIDERETELFNTIKLQEYYTKYVDNNNIEIQVTEYNSSNFNPQIILSNKVESETTQNRDNKIHKIYSHDGIFKINYKDNSPGERELFKLNSAGRIDIKGDIYKNGANIIEGINTVFAESIAGLNTTINTKNENLSNYVLSTKNILVPLIQTEIQNVSNYVLLTSNILVPRIMSEVSYASNYVVSASSIISERISGLTTDMINENANASKKFIIDKKYNDDLTVNGTLTINSNLIVLGNSTTLDTIVYTTENLSVVNVDPLSIAFKIHQNNDGNRDIFVASNQTTNVFNIKNNGDVNISGIYRRDNRNVIEDTSNYVTSTSNIIITKIDYNDRNTSNYIVDTSNILNQYINSKSPWRVINDNKISYQSNVDIGSDGRGELYVNGTIYCKEVRLLSNGIIGSSKENNRNIIEDTSNYITSTSNILITKIDYNDINTSNYVAVTSNILNQYINSKSPWQVINNNSIQYQSNVRIGIDLRVEGDVYCKEVKFLSSISDDRLKDCTSNIRNPIDLINKLNGFHYVPNNLAQQYGFKKINEIGLSAQEVQIILPEIVKLAPFDMMRDDYNNLVSKSGENYLTICYDKMAPLFVESIKALKKEINELRLEIAELRNVNK